MRFSYDDITASLLRFADQLKAAYPRDETARRVQAGQWINWPLFLSQPIVPVLLYFFPSAMVAIIIVLLAINILWMRFVGQSFVSPTLSNLGVFFARLKWLICPLMAVLLWREGHEYIALVALTWPVLLLPIAFTFHLLRPASALEETQKQFLLASRSADL